MCCKRKSIRTSTSYDARPTPPLAARYRLARSLLRSHDALSCGREKRRSIFWHQRLVNIRSSDNGWFSVFKPANTPAFVFVLGRAIASFCARGCRMFGTEKEEVMVEMSNWVSLLYLIAHGPACRSLGSSSSTASTEPTPNATTRATSC